MGVPCARAVLRAVFAARRNARPTAAAKRSVSFFTFVRFMGLFLKVGDYDQSFIHAPRVSYKPVKLFEVGPAPAEAPEHIGARDVMPALLYSRRDAASASRGEDKRR